MRKISKNDVLPTHNGCDDSMEDIYQKYKMLEEEFETFTYIVSHDLQAPLRSIISFSDLLLKHYPDHFDEKGEKYFSYVINGGRQMQKMIQSLAAYSRLNTEERSREIANIADLIKAAERECHKQINDRKAVIHTPQNMTTISCDRKQIIQVFTALIDNAIKFQPAQNKPEIKINIKEHHSDYLVTVQDNGIGIPADKFNETFNVFRRLNKPEEYLGIGMGLTLAKKIIEQHDGKIWIESELDNGTSVYFLLPKL